VATVSARPHKSALRLINKMRICDLAGLVASDEPRCFRQKHAKAQSAAITIEPNSAANSGPNPIMPYAFRGKRCALVERVLMDDMIRTA